jgi:glycosyltransferase involved in cell wall biosynthesis/MoaA/NifB/PqqE/SkfB family radical SAM enzyme
MKPPTRAPLKVLSVNTSDRGGGAECRAMSLLHGFIQRGHDAWLAVGDKKSADDRVLPLHLSPHINYRPYAKPYHLLRQRLVKSWHRFRGFEDFEFPYSHHLEEITGSIPDVIHCQNLHGGFFDLRELSRISRRIPTFLTLHDLWTFTGHCANSMDCERWRTGCGSCPYLSLPSPLQADGSRWNWERKRALHAQTRLHVTAGSHWLLKLAQESILRPAMVSSRVIRPGIDLQTYRAGSSAEARQLLDIPPDQQVVLYIANLGQWNPFKDFGTIRRAMACLATGEASRPVHLYCVGARAEDEVIGPHRIHHLDYISDAESMARYYRAADVYLHSAVSEIFGLTIAEAMACATPVIATRAGGIPEVFADGEHGLLVPPADPDAMAAALSRLLKDQGMREDMGRSAAAYAQERYDRNRMVDDYLDWFHQGVETFRAAASGKTTRASTPPLDPDLVRLEAATACQLACPECPTTTGEIGRHLGTGFLRFDDFRAFVDANPRVRRIELSNWGEIFLNPALLDIMKYAFQNKVTLCAENGVNFNQVWDEVLEGLVRYQFADLRVSIDGATQATYAKYRIKGDFDRVIANLRRLNDIKKAFASDLPRLRYQFILFGHSEAEIDQARALATELGMTFEPKLNFDGLYGVAPISPVRDRDRVRQLMGAADRQEYYQVHGESYLGNAICAQLWYGQQINYDGRVLGCCVNYKKDFGNAFTEGLLPVINGEKMEYARQMLQGLVPAREDMPCTGCVFYERRREHGRWMSPPSGRGGSPEQLSLITLRK